MKLTLKQVVESKDALQHLMDCKLPVRVAYNLQRDMRKILAEIEHFTKFNNEKIKELGTEMVPGQYRVATENMPEYEKVLGELLTNEIDLDLRQVTLSELDGVDISVRDVLLLNYLIKEEVT